MKSRNCDYENTDTSDGNCGDTIDEECSESSDLIEFEEAAPSSPTIEPVITSSLTHRRPKANGNILSPLDVNAQIFKTQRRPLSPPCMAVDIESLTLMEEVLLLGLKDKKVNAVPAY